MKVYLVGGAVRDELLGLPVKEKDYVVVGASVEEMIKQGYLPVGKDFPVFLHPQTKEEYALARTERKVGKGYKGFVFNASPEVTLEEDLRRRDLTINAIAKEGSNIIDPYHGRKDLKDKVLRHVSPAFSEDPVRILRVGRFAARFASLGFEVAAETMELMKQMVKAGEVDALVAERVWKEWERALAEKNPEKFFEVLEGCGAMGVLFPYPLDVAILEKSAKESNDAQIRFAALCHSLSEKELNELCDRYRVPSDYRDLAMLVVRHYDAYSNVKKSEAESILSLLQSVDAFRRGQRFEKFLLICEMCFNEKVIFGRGPSVLLRKSFVAARDVKIDPLIKETRTRGLELSGDKIAELIKQLRIEAIKKQI